MKRKLAKLAVTVAAATFMVGSTTMVASAEDAGYGCYYYDYVTDTMIWCGAGGGYDGAYDQGNYDNSYHDSYHDDNYHHEEDTHHNDNCSQHGSGSGHHGGSGHHSGHH